MTSFGYINLLYIIAPTLDTSGHVRPRPPPIAFVDQISQMRSPLDVHTRLSRDRTARLRSEQAPRCLWEIHLHLSLDPRRPVWSRSLTNMILRLSLSDWFSRFSAFTFWHFLAPAITTLPCCVRTATKVVYSGVCLSWHKEDLLVFRPCPDKTMLDGWT